MNNFQTALPLTPAAAHLTAVRTNVNAGLTLTAFASATFAGHEDNADNLPEAVANLNAAKERYNTAAQHLTLLRGAYYTDKRKAAQAAILAVRLKFLRDAVDAAQKLADDWVLA